VLDKLPVSFGYYYIGLEAEESNKRDRKNTVLNEPANFEKCVSSTLLVSVLRNSYAESASLNAAKHRKKRILQLNKGAETCTVSKNPYSWLFGKAGGHLVCREILERKTKRRSPSCLVKRRWVCSHEKTQFHRRSRKEEIGEGSVERSSTLKRGRKKKSYQCRDQCRRKKKEKVSWGR